MSKNKKSYLSFFNFSKQSNKIDSQLNHKFNSGITKFMSYFEIKLSLKFYSYDSLSGSKMSCSNY